MNKNRDIELIIISGRSGAGKSAALHVLEDDGYYAIDNFPGQLLTQFIDIIKTPPIKKTYQKVAISIDARNHEIDFNTLTDQITRVINRT